jgi:perosamine synthetase
MIPIYKPYLPNGSLNQAHQALNSTWLSSSGKYIQIAQEKLQDLLKVKYVLPLNNGTSACHLVAATTSRLFESSSNNKIQIIVPNNVYVAAWNSFLFDKEYQLIPIDTDLDTWNISLDELDKEIKRYPEAVVLIVHNIGNIINVPKLQYKYPGTLFVEDNCEGFLGKYEGKFSGTKSFASAISFFGNKNITCGEGGAYVTNDEESYLFAKCMQGQGQSSKRFVHSQLGYNYRMTNIQAALLCSQIDLLPEIINRKKYIFDTYKRSFDSREDIKIQALEAGTIHSNWMFGVRVPGQSSYDVAEDFFKGHGIEIRPMFYSIFTHDHLYNHPDILKASCAGADLLQKECFIIPSFPDLTQTEIQYIINTINYYVKVVQ